LMTCCDAPMGACAHVLCMCVCVFVCVCVCVFSTAVTSYACC
jgi:hypothetical protein